MNRRPGRGRWRVGLVAVMIAGGVLWAVHRWVQPIPPHRLVMTTGALGGPYAVVGERYKTVLAREHVHVELRSSSGSVENLRRLQDRSTPVEVGLVQGGIAGTEASSGLLSLGGMFYTPFWVFYRGAEGLDDLSRLVGRRIAIGPEGSGLQKLALNLLRASKTAEPPTVLVDLTGRAAVDALLRGDIDAVLTFGSPESPFVQEMLAAPDVRLMSFSQTEAYTRLFPALSHVVLPRGVFDLANHLPRADVHLLAPTTNLAVRDTVHPALVYLLLDAAVEIHGGPGLLHRAGEFPAPKTQDLQLSDQAQRFYKTGRPFLRNYLPLWVATFVDRMILLLVPGLALLIPLVGITPWLYTWRNRSRIYRWYGELKAVEATIALDARAERAAEYEAALDRIETAVQRVRVSLAFANEIYVLREHIAMVRRTLAEFPKRETDGGQTPSVGSGGEARPSRERARQAASDQHRPG